MFASFVEISSDFGDRLEIEVLHERRLIRLAITSTFGVGRLNGVPDLQVFESSQRLIKHLRSYFTSSSGTKNRISSHEY